MSALNIIPSILLRDDPIIDPNSSNFIEPIYKKILIDLGNGQSIRPGESVKLSNGQTIYGGIAVSDQSERYAVFICDPKRDASLQSPVTYVEFDPKTGGKKQDGKKYCLKEDGNALYFEEIFVKTTPTQPLNSGYSKPSTNPSIAAKPPAVPMNKGQRKKTGTAIGLAALGVVAVATSMGILAPEEGSVAVMPTLADLGQAITEHVSFLNRMQGWTQSVDELVTDMSDFMGTMEQDGNGPGDKRAALDFCEVRLNQLRQAINNSTNHVRMTNFQLQQTALDTADPAFMQLYQTQFVNTGAFQQSKNLLTTLEQMEIGISNVQERLYEILYVPA